MKERLGETCVRWERSWGCVLAWGRKMVGRQWDKASRWAATGNELREGGVEGSREREKTCGDKEKRLNGEEIITNSDFSSPIFFHQIRHKNIKIKTRVWSGIIESDHYETVRQYMR
jgi:hypothetical protein